MLITDRRELQKYTAAHRSWQGIPGIERTAGGKLYATFYSGGITEQPGNYCLLVCSGDDGATWSEPIAVAYAGEDSRCYDPCLWIDPQGRLWFFWAVMPNNAVWAAVCAQPDADDLAWEAPRVVGNDVMMNKPIVAQDGRWLLPISRWSEGVQHLHKDAVPDYAERGAFMCQSCDNGATFTRLGAPDYKNRTFDEHMTAELSDGTLLMWIRARTDEGGIMQSRSTDGGHTWSPVEKANMPGPDARFCLRTTPGGRLLLINHYGFEGRDHMAAMLSDDDGKTWQGFLMLDERSDVSYPDVTFGEGWIYITYDRERGSKYAPHIVPEESAREILLAKITEEDILAGKLVTPGAKLKQVISKL